MRILQNRVFRPQKQFEKNKKIKQFVVKIRKNLVNNSILINLRYTIF